MQVILATAKLEAPPLFKLLASSFRSRGLAFGWFSSELDPEVAQQIPTARRPAMLVAFVDPESPADDQGRVPLQMEPYTMPLKHGPMAAFLESVAQRLGQSEDKVCLPVSVPRRVCVTRGALFRARRLQHVHMSIQLCVHMSAT